MVVIAQNNVKYHELHTCHVLMSCTLSLRTLSLRTRMTEQCDVSFLLNVFSVHLYEQSSVNFANLRILPENIACPQEGVRCFPIKSDVSRSLSSSIKHAIPSEDSHDRSLHQPSLTLSLAFISIV